mmetsp:Transcript_74637/g.178024  ORF Transcript_74637/g.178024 Transcript_74637/m.178024 type:complete len:120 (+) Transcript_74637:1042-1401(+)
MMCWQTLLTAVPVTSWSRHFHTVPTRISWLCYSAYRIQAWSRSLRKSATASMLQGPCFSALKLMSSGWPKAFRKRLRCFHAASQPQILALLSKSDVGRTLDEALAEPFAAGDLASESYQ